MRRLSPFPFLAAVAFFSILIAGSCRVDAQFVSKSGSQFIYNGSPIMLYGSSFDPAAEGYTSAWFAGNFTSTIHRDITNATAAGQNIMRPTDYMGNGYINMSDPRLWTNMDFLVADCQTNGIFVEMDISAWKLVLDEEGLDDTDTNNWLAWIDYVAGRYKTNTTIAFWSIIGEPSAPTNQASANALVSFYAVLTGRLRADDPNHLICAGGFNHMESNTNLNWWQDIYALPDNDIDAYKTYSQDDLNLTPVIGNVALSAGKILINEEFGMPQYMGDGTWSGSNYNSIVTSVSTFYTNVYNAAMSAGAVGCMFWNLDDNLGPGNYDVWPTYMPATWSTIQSFSPPPQPPQNLSATTFSSSEIDLQWAASPISAVTGYNVYRSAISGFALNPTNRIAANVKTNFYADAGLSPASTNYYLVTAVNILGHESAPSAQVPPASNLPVVALLYEPFSYPTGNLTNNANGGVGWTDANWSDPSVAPWGTAAMSNLKSPPAITAPGLNYSGLATTGSAISVGSASALRAWNLASSGLFSQVGNSLWFSFLFSPGGTANNLDAMPLSNTNANDYTRGTGVQILYTGGTGTVDPYIEDGGGANNNTYLVNVGPSLPASGTALIVGQMTWNGANTGTTNDNLSVWLNPSTQVTPQTGTTNSLTVNGLLDRGKWFMIRGGSSFAGQIDELRIGTNYSSVVPPTPPLTLFLQNSGPNLQLNWSQGTLLQATNLNGPWVTNNASPPYTTSPTNSQVFFRVKVQ